MKKVLKTFVLLVIFSSAVSGAFAQLSVSISVGIAPPALPVYVQPACPTDGYLWQPGYWAYSNDDGDYYWVPGVWVAPPQPNVLWTPAYWGYEGGSYGFHVGYWGPHVGFYGGINYGFGYGGSGFGGGEWRDGGFRYNTAVVHVNTTVIHNTYIDNTVIHTTVINRTSFNGPGGVSARPNAQEEAAMREKHIDATSEQRSHEEAAKADKSQFSKVNHGKPVAAAMDKVHGTAYGAKGHAAPATPEAREKAVTARPANAAAARNDEKAAQNHQAAAQQHQQAAKQDQQAARQNQQAARQNQQAARQHQQAARKAAPRPQPHAKPAEEPKHEK